MRQIILLRHGKAETRAASGRDFDRALTENGLADAARSAERLAALGFKPARVLVSPAQRCRQTWAAAESRFPGVAVDWREDLYDIETEDLEAICSGLTGVVMIVGHNPSLQEYAVNTLFEGGAATPDIERVAARFPPGAAAVLGFGEAGGVTLEALIYPERP